MFVIVIEIEKFRIFILRLLFKMRVICSISIYGCPVKMPQSKKCWYTYIFHIKVIKKVY